MATSTDTNTTTTTTTITSTSSDFSKFTVLLLGAGFVTLPAAALLDERGFKITLGCRTLESAQSITKGLKHATPISIDVDDTDQLEAEVAKVDLVISLIPYIHHCKVIRSAIKHKKHVVTTSYVSPAMAELHKEACDAGITVLNEIGLDPGIDHLYAVKTIDEVHQQGGKILKFESYCGGLPAPENSNNPLGYKFSWSPRGVLLALRRNARFIRDGKTFDLDSCDLMNSAKQYQSYPGYSFVAYPNGDSVPYGSRYNIPECKTIIRGSLRYSVFPLLAKTLGDIGFLSEKVLDILSPSSTGEASSPPVWAEATAVIIKATSSSKNDLIWAISSQVNFQTNADKDRIISGLQWLGLFSTEERIIPRKTPLDTLCATLEKKMSYEDGERDLVFLEHTFEVEVGRTSADDQDRCVETRTSTLIEYGDPNKYSAMARLVGVPCAVAVEKVLDQTITRRGVIAPMTPDVVDPIMLELKQSHGIFLTEKIQSRN